MAVCLEDGVDGAMANRQSVMVMSVRDERAGKNSLAFTCYAHL